MISPLVEWDPGFRRLVFAFERQYFILGTQIFRNVHDYCLEMGPSMTSAHFYLILLLNLQLHLNCNCQAPASPPSSIAMPGAGLAAAAVSTRLRTLSLDPHVIG